VPEAGPARGGAPRELILADRVEDLPAGTRWIAFGGAVPDAEGVLPAGDVIGPHRARLRAAFVDWLGRMNAANASPSWWAHTTSAKNLLASPFGNAVFDLLGLRLTLEARAEPRIGIVGASDAQAAVIRRLAGDGSMQVTDRRAARRHPGLVRLRLWVQCLRAVGAWAWWLRSMRSSARADVRLFTYVDAGFRDGNDAFFGPLSDLLTRRDPPASCEHHAFLHGTHRGIVPLLRGAARFRYSPLYGELELIDFVDALREALEAAAQVDRWPSPALLEGLDLEPLFREALRQDVAGGAYYAVLLVHRAARRLAARMRPAVFLYPFENKTLEKLLLLGLREGNPGGRIVGYQHTSVTPRHTTLLFGPGEAERTPLPDVVVTTGEVTRDYLEANGRYPAGLLNAGCALRQPQRQVLPRRKADKNAHVLLVLSSSTAELIEATRRLLEVGTLEPEWQLAIRPHPEFPLSRLPESLRSAALARARDLSGTPLEENLLWADAVAYASSTAALEALMAGRPVINLDLGEPLEVDPVLEPPPFHWRARSAQDLADAVREILALGDEGFAQRRDAARAFTERYLRPPTPDRLALLLGEAPSS
jgi:hypothetical protein